MKCFENAWGMFHSRNQDNISCVIITQLLQYTIILCALRGYGTGSYKLSVSILKL